MGDMGEFWRDVKPELKKESQEKRANNLMQSLALLEQNAIPYNQLSPTHVRVKNHDYWPSTGLFINILTKRRGRGIFNLIKILKRQNDNPGNQKRDQDPA